MKKIILSASAFLFVIFSLIMLKTDICALAAEVESVTPQLSAVYLDSNGEIADGNKLTSGNYTMQLVLKDMSSISEMEFTASYGPEISIVQYSTIADKDSSFNALCKIEGGSFILCLVSLNDFYTNLESGAVLFEASITVNAEAAVDMNNIFNVSENPNFFFFETDYSDINKSVLPYTYDCYALDTDAEKYSYSGTILLMECDLSPVLSKAHNVSAYIGALARPTDSFGTYPITGAVVTVGEKYSVTDINGQFVIEGLESGTYEATVTYKCGFARTFKIVVSDSDIVSDMMIGIVGCDISEDSVVNNGDYSLYKPYVGVNSLSERFILAYDFNRDGVINNGDYAIYKNFVGKNIQNMIYDEIIIEN